MVQTSMTYSAYISNIKAPAVDQVVWARSTELVIGQRAPTKPALIAGDSLLRGLTRNIDSPFPSK